MKRFFKVVRNHVITGFIFLMPVLITIAVLSKFWNKLLVLGNKVSKFIRVDTILGKNGDAIIAVLLLLIFCVIAGFLVKMSIFKRMSDWLDDKLSLFIPGYSDLRKETEGKIGVDHHEKEEVFDTCLVFSNGHSKPAYLIDVAQSGEATVYIPAAPTFTSGQVEIVPAGSYRKLSIDSSTLNAYLKKFGKGISNS